MRKIISLLFVLLISSVIFAQSTNSPVLLTIDSVPVRQDEFERIYTKNNQNPSFDKASLDEYMELFINFKLKVIEAEARGLDTMGSFVTELNGYKAQLEKPYLTDPNADDELMKEAYERMKYNVKASHILIRCNYDALPADTLLAYNKIKDIRNQAIKKNANFNALAKKYSEDPSAQENGGDLGYFGAFSMVYEFETAAFNTEVGKVSDILRTKFGYHILKVFDKRDDLGQIKVAHIMASTPRGSDKAKIEEQRVKIFQVYDSIKAGADFADMALKYSDDKGTSTKGGELPFFGTGRMIPEFEKAAFALKNDGDISAPIQTSYGWHIIRRLELKPLEEFSVLEPEIKNKISKDIRAQKGKENLLAALKKEYKFTEFKNTLAPFYKLVDSTILTGEWDADKAKGLSELMFVLADTNKYTQANFANFIGNDGSRRQNIPISVIVDRDYTRFVEQSIINFEKSLLQEKYPEFKNLLKEYHDGILLFNLSDEMVWSKAVKDSAGLEKFYENNKQNYMWGDRVEATIYTFNNKAYEAGLVKMATKVGKKGADVIASKAKFEQKILASDSTFVLNVSKAKYSKGDNQLIDSLGWEPGVKTVVENNGDYTLVFVNKKVGPEPKLLNEARGLITADYQTFLEKAWIAELRAKYKVEINKEVFDKMIK